VAANEPLELLNRNVLPVMVAAFIDSLNVAAMLVAVETLVLPLAGDTAVTVGPAGAVTEVLKTTSTH
jgi:hypothetical protein